MSIENTIRGIVREELNSILGAFLKGTPPSQPPAPAAASPSTSPAAASGAPGAVSYEPVGDLIRKLAPTKRAEVLAILQKHGAKKGGELKPESYPEVLTALQALDK